MVFEVNKAGGPASRHAVQQGRLIARQHVYRQRQPGVRHPGAVIVVRRSPRLLRFVAPDGSILLPIQARHYGIQIQHPRRGQPRLRRRRQMPVEPGHARRFVHPGKRPSRHILRDKSCNTQQHRVDAVMAHRRDVRVAVVASKDRQQRGGEHGGVIRRVVAVGGQRAVRHPGLEQATHLEKLDKERQLSQWGHGFRRVSLHGDSPPEGVECNRLPSPNSSLA